MTKHRYILFAIIASQLTALVAFAQNTAPPLKPASKHRPAPARGKAPYGDDTPGVGPIRTEDWFLKVWHDRRATFARETPNQQHAIVFLGDSITQGWSDDFRGKFPG